MIDPLLLNDETHRRVALLTLNAENNPIALPEVLAIRDGNADVLGKRPGHRAEIPTNYECIFVIEQQLDRQWYHHLYVALQRGSSYPAPRAVSALMELFAMHGRLGEPATCVYKETDPNHPRAVNVLTPVDSMPAAAAGVH